MRQLDVETSRLRYRSMNQKMFKNSGIIRSRVQTDRLWLHVRHLLSHVVHQACAATSQTSLQIV